MNAVGTRPPSTDGSRPRRSLLVAVALVGAALIVMPFAFGMFAKTPKGAVMIEQFKPIMTASRLNGLQSDLREINAGARPKTWPRPHKGKCRGLSVAGG